MKIKLTLEPSNLPALRSLFSFFFIFVNLHRLNGGTDKLWELGIEAVHHSFEKNMKTR